MVTKAETNATVETIQDVAERYLFTNCVVDETTKIFVRVRFVDGIPVMDVTSSLTNKQLGS